MFFGEFEYKLDEKGRFLLPPKFRGDLEDGIMLSPGVEKCISIYPLAEWRKLAERLTGSLKPSKLRRLNRAFFAAAFSLNLDGQGRISLPAPLREHADIKDEVVVAGVNNYLELWSKEEWHREKEVSQEEAWQAIESLERQGD